MTSHHITYDITCTVFMTSLALKLNWQASYLCHHSDSIDGLRPTVCMTSHPPYVCHLMHSPQRHIHSLWLHTIVVITLHPLHSWHHTHYIWHYTMAIQTLYLPSDPLYLTLHPLYLCYQSKDINYTTLTPCRTPHTLYVWHHIQYACYDNNCLWNSTPLCITSHPVYFWHHIQYVLYHHTAFMTTQWLYLPSHPPFLTPQPLYLCDHTNGTHICIDVVLYRWHHNKCVSHHTWHTYDIIHNLHHITSSLYDIRPPCFLSPYPLYWSSCPLYLCHHLHSIDDITPTLSLRSHLL